MADPNMEAYFAQLKVLSAGDFQHLNGDLASHLKGTAQILQSWGASQTLQIAGLFHAAYGTAAFTDNMVSLEQRDAIANLIGKDEEALVYLYCSCDRDAVFPQFGNNTPIEFKDRYTQISFELPPNQTMSFCELTVANELELVYSSEAFKKEHGAALLTLFSAMKPFLSQAAINAYQTALS